MLGAILAIFLPLGLLLAAVLYAVALTASKSEDPKLILLDWLLRSASHGDSHYSYGRAA